MRAHFASRAPVVGLYTDFDRGPTESGPADPRHGRAPHVRAQWPVALAVGWYVLVGRSAGTTQYPRSTAPAAGPRPVRRFQPAAPVTSGPATGPHRGSDGGSSLASRGRALCVIMGSRDVAVSGTAAPTGTDCQHRAGVTGRIRC